MSCAASANFGARSFYQQFSYNDTGLKLGHELYNLRGIDLNMRYEIRENLDMRKLA